MNKHPYLVAVCAIGLLAIGGLIGANTQPILSGSGAGSILFPENATPAKISAASGAITVASGGSAQNVFLTPSGGGSVIVPNSDAYGSFDSGGTARGFIFLDANNPDILHIKNAQHGTGGNIQLEGAGGAVKAVFNIPSALFGFGGSTAPTYTVDATGDIRTTTIFRNTSTTAPAASAGSIAGNNNVWHVAVSTAITTFTVTETGSFAPTGCTVSASAAIATGDSVSGSVVSVFGASSLSGVTVTGICF